MHDTNMEIPIFNSIFKNNKKIFYKKKYIDLQNLNGTNFINPDKKKFPYIDLLKKKKIKINFYFEIILVTLNDELVNYFLNNKITFIQMQKLLLKFINHNTFKSYYNNYPKKVDDIYLMVNKVKKYLNNNEKNFL